MEGTGVVAAKSVIGPEEELHFLTLPHVASSRWPERLKIRGEWPQPVTFSHGFARAVARPWNEDLPAASLRLERGGSRFLRECTDALFSWVSEVRSPATLPGGGAVWRQAGFTESGALLLFEHPLTGLTPPQLDITEDREAPIQVLNRIDREAFPAPWRLGPLGLAESVTATNKATVHVFESDGSIQGFAVTGVSLGVAYLQRLAVAPPYQGAGIGRALVRASLRWARGRRVVTLLVNTQPDNDAAAALYRSEGFRDVAAGLQLWAYRR